MDTATITKTVFAFALCIATSLLAADKQSDSAALTDPGRILLKDAKILIV